jgi:CYTH domain-containing protein
LRIAGEKAFFTVKGAPQKNSFSRDEWEIEISSAAANEILTVCIPGTIIKTRYYVPSGAKRTFEVDVFHGRNEGLVIAEIELEHPDEWFEKPGWLGEEVTGKPEYYNSNLI